MRSQLETETRIFTGVKKQYDETTSTFKENAQVYRIQAKDGSAQALVKANEQCGVIRKGIVAFLQGKRQQFPRLFFLANEELIDIFGRGFELVKCMMVGECQLFLTNLFEGVHRVKFNEETAAVNAVESKAKETVRLK